MFLGNITGKVLDSRSPLFDIDYDFINDFSDLCPES